METKMGVCEACTNVRPIVDPNVLCPPCAKAMHESEPVEVRTSADKS